MPLILHALLYFYINMQHSKMSHRHRHEDSRIRMEGLVFTLYSIVLVCLFYFSLKWKLEGNKIFNSWRKSYPSVYELLHPILFNKFNTIWFDSVLIIIAFFFYRRHYSTLIRSSYTKGVYVITSVIVWVLMILTLFFWVGYILSIPLVVEVWGQ
jgi:hypothetical protein